MNKTNYHKVMALILAAGIAAGCGGGRDVKADDPAKAATAAVVKVTRQDLANNLEIASELEPFQEIEVYAKVSGYIKKLHVEWGTHVKQGQLLAELEIPELQQQVQQDEAALRRSEQDHLRAQEELNRADSAYNVAHLTYTRLADVQKSRPELVAQQEIDVAQGKDLEASAGVSAARDALSASQQEMLSAKAALEKDRAVFAYARMTAPFDGVVTEIYAYTGALLPAGTSSNKGTLALCRLSQNNVLRLVIPVPERAVGDIRNGQTVAIEVSGTKKTFNGEIARSSGQIEAQTRTMHTEVQVPNPKYELVPGMYASVKIPLHSAKNVLSLPVQAVQSGGEGEGSVLLVKPDNRLEKRTVKLGLQTATQVEVLSGLQQDDMVIFGEQGQYKPGEMVKPKLIQPGGAE
ncbi:MAG TPA: efflux RND transporter periplasmic adaptor subunit [Candidatus Limnocylindria bacterium]|nr:efflux RND transporter periplasmic adaptor subunit [Candidatus Limnocylindria bacterium]